ncbi:MAG: hypothetical protein WDW38_007395 [Sanguina aurantia]
MSAPGISSGAAANSAAPRPVTASKQQQQPQRKDSMAPADPPSSPPRVTASAAARRILLSVSSTLLWMLASSLLIILNKQIYVMGFRFPFFVTGMGQAFSAAAGLALGRLKLLTLRPVPSARTFATKLLPIVLCSTGTMYFGNAAYLTLSVAFIQILKAFTPGLTLLLCLAAGLERAALPLAAAIALIALGTAAAALVESGTPGFCAVGFALFMASSVTEAGRVVGAEVLLGSQKYNTAEALLYIGAPTTLLLLLGAGVWERDGLLSAGLPLLQAHPLPFLAAFTMSALVNMACFFAIQSTSSLSFKVGVRCQQTIGAAVLLPRRQEAPVACMCTSTLRGSDALW